MMMLLGELVGLHELWEVEGPTSASVNLHHLPSTRHTFFTASSQAFFNSVRLALFTCTVGKGLPWSERKVVGAVSLVSTVRRVGEAAFALSTK